MSMATVCAQVLLSVCVSSIQSLFHVWEAKKLGAFLTENGLKSTFRTFGNSSKVLAKIGFSYLLIMYLRFALYLTRSVS